MCSRRCARWCATRGVRDRPAADAAARRPVPDADSARQDRPDASPWWRSLDGTWDLRLFDSLDQLDPRALTEPSEDDLEVQVPSAWTTQRDADGDRLVAPHYTNVIMPSRGAAAVPRANPVGCPPALCHHPEGLEGSSVVLRVGAAESVGRGLHRRRVRRRRHRQPPAERVRPDRTRARRPQGADRAGRRPLVGGHLARGPGPVVARRHPAQRHPVQHRGDPSVGAGDPPGSGPSPTRAPWTTSSSSRGQRDGRTAGRSSCRSRRSTGPDRVDRSRPPVRRRCRSGGARTRPSSCSRGLRRTRRAALPLDVPGVRPWHHEAPTRYRALIILRDRRVERSRWPRCARASGPSRSPTTSCGSTASP